MASGPVIDKLLSTVIEVKASDLFVTVGSKPALKKGGRLRLLETKVLDNDDATALMKSITPDRCQQELQEKGGTDFAIQFKEGNRFRVAVFKQRGNIGIVLRRIPSQFLTFEQIGMPEAIRRLITRPRGLLLVTGPTGSGKTTSLASMINWINDNMDRHIITIEDPIEYFHKHKKSLVTAWPHRSARLSPVAAGRRTGGSAGRSGPIGSGWPNLNMVALATDRSGAGEQERRCKGVS